MKIPRAKYYVEFNAHSVVAVIRYVTETWRCMNDMIAVLSYIVFARPQFREKLVRFSEYQGILANDTKGRLQHILLSFYKSDE